MESDSTEESSVDEDSTLPEMSPPNPLGGNELNSVVKAFRFLSNFDSGNLRTIEYNEETKTYDAFISKDCYDTSSERDFRMWYYFGVQPIETCSTMKVSKTLFLLYFYNCTSIL